MPALRRTLSASSEATATAPETDYMITISAFFISAAIRLVPAMEPPPDCRVVDRSIRVTSEVSRASAFEELELLAAARGADTVRIMVDRMIAYRYPARRRWVVVGKTYQCRRGER